MLVEAHGSIASTDNVQEPAEAFLISLRQMTTSEARQELLKFVGVGRKVADCILLMSLDKREVIPVDTHVQQIAAKHYGLRAPVGKTNMTPKLYEEVSSKLTTVWGEYAGWAHSVLFTSDLKAFATYGLPSPSPSPTKEKQPIVLKTQIPTPPDTPDAPSPTPAKGRKRRSPDRHAFVPTPGPHKTNVVAATLETLDEELTMADRVKRRRRSRAVVISETLGESAG